MGLARLKNLDNPYLGDSRNEAFREFSNINIASNSGRIKFLRLYLVFLMADIINDSLKKSKDIHRRLINELNNTAQLERTIFLTTNYDPD